MRKRKINTCIICGKEVYDRSNPTQAKYCRDCMHHRKRDNAKEYNKRYYQVGNFVVYGAVCKLASEVEKDANRNDIRNG